MAINNPTSDHFNPPSNLSQDFEEFRFEDLEVDELFWQTNKPKEDNPWRKIGESQGLNLRTQTTHNFKPRTKVFQRI